MCLFDFKGCYISVSLNENTSNRLKWNISHYNNVYISFRLPSNTKKDKKKPKIKNQDSFI